jgi:hypothetical protein
MSSLRKKNDLVDTRSRLTAYPSVVIKKFPNIVFPHRITGAVKARTRPVTQPCDLTQQQLPILGVRDIDLIRCSPDDLGTRPCAARLHRGSAINAGRWPAGFTAAKFHPSRRRDETAMMDEHEGRGLTEFLDDRLEYRR